MFVIDAWYPETEQFWPLLQPYEHEALCKVYTGQTVLWHLLDSLAQKGEKRVRIHVKPAYLEAMREQIPQGIEVEFTSLGSNSSEPESAFVKCMAQAFGNPYQSPWDLLRFNLKLLQNLRPYDVGIHRRIENHRYSIRGDVHIEEDVFIGAAAIVRGPCVLKRGAHVCDHATVEHSYVGEGVHVGHGSQVKKSFVYDNAQLHMAQVSYSVIGPECNLGRGTRVSDIRLDGAPVLSDVRGRMVATNLPHAGTVIGAKTITGVNVSIAAGVKIGSQCQIGHGAILHNDVLDQMEVSVDLPLVFKKL